MRLGLLAAARITGPAVIDAVASVPEVEVVALAARSPERARASAADWGVHRVHDSYDDLIADPELDAIYVATPAALHHRWTVAALRAGKHVLCEKPLAANAAEARDMVQEAALADRVLMEAYHWRYHPFVDQVADVLRTAPVGPIRHVHGRFLVPDGRIGRDDIRWDLGLGGGALMDLGCYPAQWVRWVGSVLGFGEPSVTSAHAECPVPEVDGALGAELAWTQRPDGPTATIECSMISDGPAFVAELVVTGTEGSVVVTNPLAPQHGAGIDLRTATGVEHHDSVAADTSTYQWQMRAFRDAVDTGNPPLTCGADSIATMELIDACYRAAGLAPRPSLPDVDAS